MVSLIIPVYNKSRYLQDCINSALEQDISQYEIILVDDGSTDGSGEICDAAQSKSRKIKVIHQENMGVSAARNTGIFAAKGKYLAFMDADDTITADMLSTLVSTAQSNNAEIAYCAYRLIEEGVRDEIFALKPELQAETQQEKTRRLVEEHYIYNSMCNKIYDREFILKNEICVPEGIIIGEDALFNLKAFSQCSKSVYVDKPLYIYNYREGSAMHTSENRRNRFNLIKKRCEICTQIKLKEEMLEEIASQFYICEKSEFNKTAKQILLQDIDTLKLDEKAKKCYKRIKSGTYPLYKFFNNKN